MRRSGWLTFDARRLLLRARRRSHKSQVQSSVASRAASRRPVAIGDLGLDYRLGTRLTTWDLGLATDGFAPLVRPAGKTRSIGNIEARRNRRSTSMNVPLTLVDVAIGSGDA